MNWLKEFWNWIVDRTSTSPKLALVVVRDEKDRRR